MFNTVETILKEKLRSSLSEPNNSSRSSRTSLNGKPLHGTVHPERSRKRASVGFSDNTATVESDQSNINESSNPLSNERRARWILHKAKNKNIGVNESFDEHIPVDHDKQNESFIKNSGEVDLELGKKNPCNIVSDSDSYASGEHGSQRHRNKWKHRGGQNANRRIGHSLQARTANSRVPSVSIIDEMETETDGSIHLTAEGICNVPSDSDCGTLTRKRNIRRYSAPNKMGSPSSKSPSISSDSEGEHESARRDPSTMLTPDNDGNPNNCNGRRKQSVFFSTYGVWSEESVMRSFRDLSPPQTSILEASWQGQAGTLEELFENPESLQNVNCTDAKGRTPLHLACAAGHAGVVEILLEKGAEVEAFDTSEKATPLMCASASGSLACVELLLNAGANVNANFDTGKTPLHWAVQAGAYECAKKLLEAGAKQNPPLAYSENPLHVASSTGDVACLQILLDYGADVSFLKGTSRATALHIAAEEGNSSVIKLLLKAGASHAAQDARGHTPLHVAASVDAESTSVLIKAGADPNARDRDGRTPLHCSISRGSRAAECLRILVETNADINVQDNFGYTGLHLAAVNESSQCAAILLKHGADVTIKTKAGTTALSLLVRRIPDVMRFIMERLDSAITIQDHHEAGDPDCEVRLDFRAVVPNSDRSPKGKKNSTSKGLPEQPYYHKPRKETDFLTCVLAAGYKKVLAHPISEAFLTLKWQRVRKFFWASLLFQVALVLLFTVYVIDVYLIKCPARGMPITERPNINLPKIHSPTKFPITNLNQSNSTSALPAFTISTTGKPDATENRRNKRSTFFNIFSFYPTSKPKTKKSGRYGTTEASASRGNINDENDNLEFGVRSLFTRGKTAIKKHQESNSVDLDNIEGEPTNTNDYYPRDEETIQYKKECHNPEPWLTVVWCLLISFTGFMGIKETFQFLQAPLAYMLSSENWGQWALISSVLIASWPDTIPYPDRQDWQYPAAAFGMFLAWGLLLLQVGRFPALGLYVQMLGKVAANFGLVILAYACLLIAFALAFCVIFPGEPAYYSVPLAILKVLTMMVGEVDYEELFYNSNEPLLYPITAHLLHAAFVVFITIVLMNLLVGLAVSDIQGLQKGAKLNRLSRQTALISRLESFIFSKKLQALLPGSVGLILQRSALLVPSSYNWSFYFRPNDSRDKRLGKELKQAALRLASARHTSKHATKTHTNSFLDTNRQQYYAATESSLKRMEQRLDDIQRQMELVMFTLSTQMETITQIAKKENQSQHAS